MNNVRLLFLFQLALESHFAMVSFFLCSIFLRLSAELCPHHSKVVVVSPLKSLMDDQVAMLSSRGMKCASLHGDGHTVMQSILHDEYQLVFISRESMLRDLIWREMFSSEVYQKNLVALVVNEAHCVDKWYAI